MNHRILRFFPVLFLAWLIGICCNHICFAGQHYVSGLEGLRVATLPPPGFYYRMYNAYYTSNKLRDNNGDVMPVDFTLNSYINVNRFVYSSNWQILGGRFVADLVVPVAVVNYTMNMPALDISQHENTVGLADILTHPFMISWNKERFDVSFGLGVFLPAGKYDANDPSSPGKGFWTFKPGLGGTYYFDEAKMWSASVAFHYEMHSSQRNTHIKYGDNLIMEWGAGRRFLSGLLEAGVVGYSSWQTTENHGEAATSGKSRVNGAGLEMSMVVPAWKAQMTARSIMEYDARNSTQGVMSSLVATFKF